MPRHFPKLSDISNNLFRHFQIVLTFPKKIRYFPTIFSDIQIKGPYSHWCHTHKFEEKNGGTLIKDHVVYKVPFGLLGDLIVGKWIKKDLETIFSYRTKTIDTLMNN